MSFAYDSELKITKKEQQQNYWNVAQSIILYGRFNQSHHYSSQRYFITPQFCRVVSRNKRHDHTLLRAENPIYREAGTIVYLRNNNSPLTVWHSVTAIATTAEGI